MIESRRREIRRREMSFRAISALCFAFIVFVFIVIVDGLWFDDERWVREVLRDHYAATVGGPMMAIAATVVVSLFRSMNGPIEFEALSFRFQGASGPIVMWVIVFATMAWVVRLLW